MSHHKTRKARINAVVLLSHSQAGKSMSMRQRGEIEDLLTKAYIQGHDRGVYRANLKHKTQ